MRHTEPTPIPVPGIIPAILVEKVVARQVFARIIDPANPTRRSKPPGVAGIAIFSYVGPTAPTDPAAYKFEGNTMKTKVIVQFPDSVASGAQVWLCAFFFNPRGYAGTACQPVATNLQGGAAVAA
jgi:hypothetical protein